MLDYYRRRAAYYERVYHKPERQADLRVMEQWLADDALVGRDVLEIACGTGWWTPFGARHSRRWLATDLSEETLTIARAKPLPAEKVEFAIVDAWTLQGLPERPFDAAFAGCWWSHVPLQRLSPWLALLHSKLAGGARVVMLDNSFVQTSSLPISRRDEAGNTYQQRTLDDGSMHEVLKNFPTREQAFEAVRAADGRVRELRWTAHAHYWTLDYTLA